MPIPLVPIIAAAATLIGGIINNRAQKKRDQAQNKAQMELSKYSYEQEQLGIDRQNQYNSPAMQMDRYTAAGLNPNLIYGSGASGGNQSSTPKFDTPSVVNRVGPLEIPNMLGAYQQWEMQKAQIDSIKAQTQNTQERTKNEAMQNFINEFKGRHLEFDYDTKTGLRPYEFQAKELDVRSKTMRLDMDVQQLKNMRQDQIIKMLVAQEKERNLTSMDLDQERKVQEIIFNKYRNEWAKEGITTSDNPYLRILSRMLIQSGLNPSQYIKPKR